MASVLPLVDNAQRRTGGEALGDPILAEQLRAAVGLSTATPEELLAKARELLSDEDYVRVAEKLAS